MKFLITGASGFIAQHLTRVFLAQNHEVNFLSRSKNNLPNSFVWNVERMEIDLDAFESVDAIVHLAGANIGEKRWTSARKLELENSRVKSAQLLYDAVSQLKIKPKSIISASAVGFYGAQTKEIIFDENSNPAADFLGQLCEKWENEVFQFQNLGLRCVCLRTGVVLGQNQGALAKIITPFHSLISVILGSGRQILPWIHLKDLGRIYLLALENTQMHGAYNAVSPQKTTYAELVKSYADFKNEKPLFLKIPRWFLKLVLGDMHQLLCYGSAISTKKIQNMGFVFNYPNLLSVWRDFFKK